MATGKTTAADEWKTGGGEEEESHPAGDVIVTTAGVKEITMHRGEATEAGMLGEGKHRQAWGGMKNEREGKPG